VPIAMISQEVPTPFVQNPQYQAPYPVATDLEPLPFDGGSSEEDDLAYSFAEDPAMQARGKKGHFSTKP